MENTSGMSNEERNQSLQELEGLDWGEPPFSSHLVHACYALRRKPLRDFTTEDLRMMIGQNIGLNYLMPMALEQLQRDPLVAGDFYSGDLLEKVLRVQADFWQTHPDLHRAVAHLVKRLKPFPDGLRKPLEVFQQAGKSDQRQEQTT